MSVNKCGNRTGIFVNTDDDSQCAVIAQMDIPLKSHIFDEKNHTLEVLDQLLLPHETRFIPIDSVEDGYSAIKKMQVRGAPLIATVGMLSLVVDLYHQNKIQNKIGKETSNIEDFVKSVKAKCNFLVSSRPTAINLSKIADQLKSFIEQSSSVFHNVEEARLAVIQFIYKWQRAERYENALLIRNSISCINQIPPKDDERGLVIMTICNTGALATSSFGTALGVIVHLRRLGKLKLAIALETRPYNQGSRLTSYELLTFGVPFRLIPDGAAASAMKHFSVDAILVGADQVAANGDTANKIGTYSLAILANHHSIPFFVVTPISSVNLAIPNGERIKIEERPPEELTIFNGIRTCPPECPVWNPAFDVTPASLITEILTERGNFLPENLHKALS